MLGFQWPKSVVWVALNTVRANFYLSLLENLLDIQVSPDLVQCKSRLLMYYKRQCRILAFRNRNQSNQHHMNNLVEIDISHEHILRHSLEFGTVLGYFLTLPLKGLTVVLTGLVPTENHDSWFTSPSIIFIVSVRNSSETRDPLN